MQHETPQDEISSLPAAAARHGVIARSWTEICARRGMLGLAIAAAVFNALAAPIVMATISLPGNYASSRQAMVTGFVMPIIIGLLCGEVGAMACWLVWGPGPFLRRLATHWGFVFGMGLCLFCGVVLASGDLNYEWQLKALFEATASVACVLPAVSLSVQLPLWPFRTHLGWRLTPLGDGGTASRQALSILDVLIGTTIVAISLGLIQFLPRGAPNSVRHLIMVQMLVSGLGLALVSFVLLIPAMILLLRSRSFGAGAGIYFSAVLLSVGALIVVPSIIFDGLPPVGGIIAMLWGSFVFAATVAAPLFVWRACGYRLVWARDRR